MCIDEGMIREEIRQRAERFRADFIDLDWEKEGEVHRENEGWIIKTCVCEGYEVEPYLEDYRARVRYDAEG